MISALCFANFIFFLHLEKLANTEISQFRFKVTCYQDILGFDISVYYVIAMHYLNRYINIRSFFVKYI